MTGPGQEPLRSIVLTGRHTGAGPGAEAAARFVASADRGLHLEAWFGREWLRDLAAQPDRGSILRAALARDIAIIDEIVTAQVDAVTQHPRFTRLEGSWRGLDWLVACTPQSARVKVKVLHARWTEVCRDLERALEFDQSEMFSKVYEEEFGMAGGEPIGLIAADYELRHRPGPGWPTDDVAAVVRFASVAAAAFAPTVFGAAPDLLGLETFAEAPSGANLAAVFASTEYQRWRGLGSQEDLRFVGVALPRVLARPAWPEDGTRADRFVYRSAVPDAGKRVWMSAVYAFAAVAVRAFERNAWPADVRGAGVGEEPGGGVVDDLAVQRFPSDFPDGPPPRPPVELALTDDQESQLGQIGLIPLAALEGLPEACFGVLPTLHRPPRMSTAAANANQRLSSQLNSMLCVSRFAHIVKIMGRDMLGSALDASDVELRLQRWLDGYVSGIGSEGASVTARFPLQEAKVEVREQSAKPGSYYCVIHLRPHYQLDEIGASFRFITEFAARPAAA